MIDQTESCKLLLSVSTSLYIRATLLCLTFYIRTHERASKQTWLRGYPEGAWTQAGWIFSGRMNQRWVKRILDLQMAFEFMKFLKSIKANIMAGEHLYYCVAWKVLRVQIFLWHSKWGTSYNIFFCKILSGQIRCIEFAIWLNFEH